MVLFDKKTAGAVAETEPPLNPVLTTPPVETPAPPDEFKSGIYTLDPTLTSQNIVRLLNEMVSLGNKSHGVHNVEELASKDGKAQFRFVFKKLK